MYGNTHVALELARSCGRLQRISYVLYAADIDYAVYIAAMLRTQDAGQHAHT